MTMAGDPSTGRPRHDWSARARSSVIDARRYTRFVMRMKRVTALSALAVILAVLGFFFVARAPRNLPLSFETLGSLKNDLAMVSPRLSGMDSSGNPFVITARLAVQDAKNPKRATLENVEADLTTPKGWLNARAMHGHVDMNASWLTLDSGIDVFSDSGYSLHTERADVDLKHNVVIGNREVAGQGPLGAIRADAFRYDHVAGRLTLHGHVKTVIHGKGK
ncbi:MAG: LPS export ABC transporter periplasmic protein LptC [Alphaproteobacteria bacterium]|nr:LPS export ABC transporter periplasmic protein LptC [Alphaproteobacteria bacterium]